MKSLEQFILVATFAALAGTSLHAQTVDLKAAIPFDFRAGDTSMPAGEYLIHEQGPVIFLRGADKNGQSFALMTIGADGQWDSLRSARLDFNCYGRECFLATVWDSFTQVGRSVLPTARQKELAKLQNVPARATVALIIAK
jgi:hypothetical protein